MVKNYTLILLVLLLNNNGRFAQKTLLTTGINKYIIMMCIKRFVVFKQRKKEVDNIKFCNYNRLMR